MEKIIKDNLKKITALLLVGTMIMSLSSSAYAQDNVSVYVIESDDNDRDEIIIAEDTPSDETKARIISEQAEEEFLEEVNAEAFEEGAPDILYLTEYSSDEEARQAECMPNDYFSMRLLTYLSLKYNKIGIDPHYRTGGKTDIADHTDDLYNLYNATKMKLQTEYDTIVIDGEDTFPGYPDLTRNMVQFRYLGCFGESKGSDEQGNIVYSDNVKTLIIRNVDEIRNLYVPASLETLIIENTTFNCYSYPKDSPGFQSGMIPGDLKNCKNLKKLVLKNVKFGDNYKNTSLLNYGYGSCDYETNYILNLQNCTKLEELEIDVSFEGAKEVQLAIDGGTENLFEKLTADKCNINPAPGTGYGQIRLYANENSYLAKRYTSSETVEFVNGQFRIWLLEAIGIDTNHDGVISQEEMDAIENLTINDQTAHSAEQTSLSAFQELADIGQMHCLKTLDIDFYDPGSSYLSTGNRHTLKGIDFPESLENLSMKNIYWEKDTQTKSHDNADIILTNLKNLELYNTEVRVGEGDSYFNYPTRIELTDTEGALESCIISQTDVVSVKLINNSEGKNINNDDEKHRIRFSASDCDDLESIEFLGEGYAVEGSLDLTNDEKLTHIGVPNGDKSQWTVYGEFDMTYAPVNVILNGCSMLGGEVIDYDFVSGRDLYVQTMNTNFKTGSELTILRKPRLTGDYAGKVYLSCDKGSWVYNNYTQERIDAGEPVREAKDGFVIESGSSFPTIAVFAAGQRIRTSGEGNHNSDSIYTENTDCWVERWNLVMQPGGYSNNFGNLSFYVVDKVPDPKNSGAYIDSLRRVFYKDDVYVEWNQQNDTDPIITLPLIENEETGDCHKLNGTKLLSTGKAGEVELKLYVYEKDSDGTLRKNGNGDYIKSYIGFQNIKIFEMPDSVELVNDGTSRGSGTKNDPYIVGKNEELKLKARLMVNDDVDRSGDYALRDVYWRIKEYDETPKYTSDSDGYSLYTLDSATKAGISVVRGKLNEAETYEQYDRRIDNTGSEPTYYNHRRFKFDTVGTKFKIVAQSPYKYNDSVISSEIYVEYKESVVEDPTPSPAPADPTPVVPTPVEPTPVNPTPVDPTPVDPAPVEPVDETIVDEKNTGKYIMPNPSKNEVVYIAPPGNGTKKTITIPDEILVDGKVLLVVKIGPEAFKNNKYVKTINVGKNIKVIGNGAFEGATNLTKITLGKNVKTIGDRTFKNCPKLTAITIPDKTTGIGNKAFEGDKKLKKVTIGKNVVSIGDGAFKDCKLLGSISLPSKTTKIGVGVFKGCSQLKTIKITSKKLTSKTIASGAFNGLTGKTTIKVPKSVLKKYKKLFKNKKINSKVIIKGY